MATNSNAYLSLPDTDLYYEVHGAGEPLLILHGMNGSGAGLAETFNTLTSHYQLIIPDLRGHGRSSNRTKQFSFRECAQDTLYLLDFLKIKSCSAIGFSGGGCTLLYAAYLQLEKFKTMTLVSAAPYFPESTREIIKHYNAAPKTETDLQAMRKIHLLGDEQIEMLWQQQKALANNNDLNFTPEKLAQITIPTLIVQGDRDPIYPIELTIEMYRSMPNAFLWIIPNGGHVPITNELLPTFINQIKFLLRN